MRDLDLSQVRVSAPHNVQVRNSPTLQKLFWSSDADLALSVLQPRKRLVYLGFDLLDSNFPSQTAFPLFIRRSIDWLTATSLTPVLQTPGLQTSGLQTSGLPTAASDSRERRRQIPAGDSLTIEFPVGTEEISIATPDGSASAVAMTSTRYTFTDTSTTGFYQYTVAGVKNYIAANLTDESESNINQRVSSRPTSALNRSNTSAGIIKVALWPYLAWLALALLFVEWWLWCARREHA